MTEPLSFATLKSAVSGGFAAFRINQRLQPMGGAGDKIFPPTYATGDKSLRYAEEDRRIEGEKLPCILVDSVASQANRMEEALLRAWEDEEVHFPVIRVDFSEYEELRDLGSISTLTAPHRVYDALLRDSVDGDTLFRDTPLGASITQASAKAATPLYIACPTTLLFGGWDSTGPRGGLGNKVQRAIASELVAINVVPGVKTSSRLDPAGIQGNVPVYQAESDPNDYTIHASGAAKKNGKPIVFSRKGGDGDGKGKASAVNHSNIAPSIDKFAGGITCDYIRQTTVLSLPALRRIRFPEDQDGKKLDGQARRDAELAARTSLAALGLTAIVLLSDEGFDLRSRCALVPEGSVPLELVSAQGHQSTFVELSRQSAIAILKQAAEEAASYGLAWKREPIRLKPADKLADLIVESRKVSADKAESGE